MDNFQLNLILLAPLFVGILLSQLVKLPLKGLTGLYLLLVVGNVLLWFFLMEGQILTPVIFGVVGLLVAVIATGFLYKKLNPSDFALIMAGVGLFPWLLWGVLADVAYAVVLGIFAALIALRPKFKNPFVRRYK